MFNAVCVDFDDKVDLDTTDANSYTHLFHRL